MRASTTGAGFRRSRAISSIRRWPGRKLPHLRSVTGEAGFELRERLAAYPEYMRERGWMPEICAAARWLGRTTPGWYGRDQEAA